jgi:hypothetical protein
LCLRGEIEAAILLGEAFRFEDTLLPYPANATHAQRDNVNGQPCGLGVKLLAEVAERASARFFAVCHDNYETRFVAVVEHVSRLSHGRCQRRFSGRRQRFDRSQDGCRGILCRPQLELDVALIVGTWSEGDEAHAANPGDAR